MDRVPLSGDCAVDGTMEASGLVSDLIKLFVGASAQNEDLEAEIVLAFSARKYCTLDLDITFMRQAASGPWSNWASNANGRTPFSAFRWSLPSVCGYKGKALYTDVDFVFLSDLTELWNQPIPNVALVRNATGKLTTSCILFDCTKAKGHVPDLDVLRAMPDTHGSMLRYFRAHPQLLTPFAGNWDCPDLKGSSLDDPTLKAVHFTRISSQLHLKHAIPRLKAEGRTHWYQGVIQPHPRPELQALFDHLLLEAHAEGYTLDRYRVEPFGGATRKNFVYANENRR